MADAAIAVNGGRGETTQRKHEQTCPEIGTGGKPPNQIRAKMRQSWLKWGKCKPAGREKGNTLYRRMSGDRRGTRYNLRAHKPGNRKNATVTIRRAGGPWRNKW